LGSTKKQLLPQQKYLYQFFQLHSVSLGQQTSAESENDDNYQLVGAMAINPVG
jgi:hypothetical protein